MNRQHKEIAAVYLKNKAQVRELVAEKLGICACTLDEEKDVRAVVQLLDDEFFAAQFWALDKKSNWVAAVAGIIGAGANVFSTFKQAEMQKDQLSDNQLARDHQADMLQEQGIQQEAQNDFQREQTYYQQLMQDQSISWSREHDYNDAVTGILSSINEQEKLEKQKNLMNTAIAGSVLIAVVVAIAIKNK